MLHPHYRGHLLQKSGEFEEVKAKLVDSHPSTQEFHEKQQESERQKETQAPIASRDTDDLDIFTMDSWNPNQTTGQNTSQCIPDIERELNIFLQMPPLQEGASVDVLSWWKKQQVNLPLLAEVARGAFCVPAASSSSERVFSASGGIVTDKRYNLASGSLKMLTLCKVNYDFVSEIMTIKTMSREEECTQIQQQILSDLQMTPCTSAQTSTSTSKTRTQTKLPFKTVTKNKHQLICLSSSSSSNTSPEQSPPKRTPERRTIPCLPPGVESKGKGKGKSSLTPTPRTPSQKRPSSEMDTQELPPTQIRKRPKNSGLTPKDIQESLDMFDHDDDTEDPDFMI